MFSPQNFKYFFDAILLKYSYAVTQQIPTVFCLKITGLLILETEPSKSRASHGIEQFYTEKEESQPSTHSQELGSPAEPKRHHRTSTAESCVNTDRTKTKITKHPDTLANWSNSRFFTNYRFSRKIKQDTQSQNYFHSSATSDPRETPTSLRRPQNHPAHTQTLAQVLSNAPTEAPHGSLSWAALPPTTCIDPTGPIPGVSTLDL